MPPDATLAVLILAVFACGFLIGAWVMYLMRPK